MFFAIDDIIVTSVDTYTSIMGITPQNKYLNKSLPENKKYGAQRLLKCLLTKSLGGLKVLTKKFTTQVLLFDVLGSG